MRRSLWALVLVAVLAAGCNTEPANYKAEPTGKCLRDKLHYLVITDPKLLGVVEGSAARGGLLVHHPGNAIRIAFGRNADDVPGIESGFRRFAPLKVRRHIDDVMRSNKNVVFLWTVSPSQEEVNSVFGCLKG